MKLWKEYHEAILTCSSLTKYCLSSFQFSTHFYKYFYFQSTLFFVSFIPIQTVMSWNTNRLETNRVEGISFFRKMQKKMYFPKSRERSIFFQHAPPQWHTWNSMRYTPATATIIIWFNYSGFYLSQNNFMVNFSYSFWSLWNWTCEKSFS